MEEYIAVLITTSGREEAERIAMQLINSGYAPCINIVAPCSSIYQWKGEVHRTEEALMIVKSRKSSFSALREFVERIHSYDVPEILGVPVSCVSDDYASFLSGFFEGGGR
jgi:periplasmic divalent cation tolerance protein